MSRPTEGALTLRERLTLALYRGLTWALQPWVKRKLLRRALQEPPYGWHMAQRFGDYTGCARPEGVLVWVHAVSLGETRAAAILLAALREALPGMTLLLTHSTATGWQEGQRLLRDGDVQAWLPWDTVHATESFLRHFKPHVGVLMETEVWPQLVQACASAGVPLCVANARLNEKSHRQAIRWPALSGPAYRGLAAVWAQSDADAQRLRELGAPVQAVLGNLKFDIAPNPTAQAQAARWREVAGRPVALLASSREGEEQMWWEALHEVTRSEVLWCVVPRHPQRFESVGQMLTASGVTWLPRSAWGDQPAAGQLDGVKVVLGDSMGEMPVYAHWADMALLGGSFAPLGGQNLIELAACGCPVIMGPHTFNFAEAAERLQAAGAAIRVNDMRAALAQVGAWMAAPAERTAAQEAGLACVAAGQGSAKAHAERIVARVWAPTRLQ